jgi:predicted XRE-type DNA-binding protein
MTEWRTIPSFPAYEASNDGRVRRVAGSEMSVFHRADGYKVVSLHSRPRYVHRLVCEAFHGLASDGQVTAHLDGNRGHNLPANLAWVTPTENEAHKVIHGTRARGSRCGAAKLDENLVIAIRAAYRMKFATQTAMATAFGVSQTKISDVVNYRTWRHVE